MLCRCLANCGAVILIVTIICRLATVNAAPKSCRAFRTLADLLPNPEDAPVPEQDRAKFKEFVHRARRSILNEAPAADDGKMPVCEGNAYRSARNLQDKRGRRLQTSDYSSFFEEGSVKMDYLTNVASPIAAQFVYRRGAVVQKFAGLGVKAGVAQNPAGPPNKTFFNAPTGMVTDYDTGDIYVADTGQSKVQKLTKSQGYAVTTLFDGRWQNVSEGSRVVEISMMSPTAVAFDAGFLFIADEDNSRIIRVRTVADDGSPMTSENQTEDTVAVVANSAGERGMSGDCGPATAAKMRIPRALYVIQPHKGNPLKSLAIADSGNNRIRTLEITDWPTCISKQGVDCSSDSQVIDTTTGGLCASGSDCGVNVNGPDFCAFLCGSFGTGKYPTPLPQVDIAFTSADVQSLLAGCGTFSAASNLLDCSGISSLSAEQQKIWLRNWESPANLRYWTMRTDFTLASGTVIPAGNRLMGAMVGGRLKRLNFTEVQASTWNGLSATFRFATVSVQACGMWSFQQTLNADAEGLTNAGGVFTEYVKAHATPTALTPQVGKCYLLTSDDVADCSSGSDIAGVKACRPGKMQTILGGGAPGLPESVSPAGTPRKMNALKMRLARPSGMTMINDGQSLAPMQSSLPKLDLVVSDTANHRLVAKSLLPVDWYVVRMWMFIAGENAEQFVTSLHSTALTWAIQGVLGWGIPIHIVHEDTRLARDVTTEIGAHTSCDKDREEAYDFWYEKLSGFDAKISGYCEMGMCQKWQELTFSSEACCRYFCETIMRKCDGPLLSFRAAPRSYNKCSAYSTSKNCVDPSVAAGLPASTSCSAGVPAGTPLEDDARQDLYGELLGVSENTNWTEFEEACDSIASQSDAIGCGGICDLKMADIVGVNHEWIGSNETSKSVVGILFEFTTYNRNEFIRVSEAISSLKAQEEVVQGQRPTGAYPATDDRDPWGPGTLLHAFMDFFILLVELYQYSATNYRVSFSSPVGYDKTAPSDFGFMRQVDSTAAQWMVGGGEVSATQPINLKNPAGIVFDRALRGYMANVGYYQIVRLTGEFSGHGNTDITKIAGNGYSSFNGNGNLGRSTGLLLPTYVDISSEGVLHFADSKQHEVRQILGLTWNLPCEHSDQYWGLLTNASSTQKTDIQNLMDCRDAQLRIEILHIIEQCRLYYFDEKPGSENLNISESYCIKRPANSDEEAPQYYTQLQADLRNAVFEVPPDCTICADYLTNPQFGCSQFQASLTWNNTDDTWHVNTSTLDTDTPIRGYPVVLEEGKQADHEYKTDEGNEMVWEMTWLLRDTTAEILLQAMRDIQYRITNTSTTELFAQTSSAGSELKPYLEAVIEAHTNHTAYREAVDDLKTALCLTRNSNPRGRLLLYHWYLQIVNVCVQITDSQFAFHAGLVGGQFYDTMSALVTNVFDLVFDFVTDTSNASICHPGCNLLHPRFFGSLPWLYPPGASWSPSSDVEASRTQILPVGPRFGTCCGQGGYRCGFAEGPCQVDSDCQVAMACRKDTCLWGKGESCCQPADGPAYHLLAREAAEDIGYAQLVVTSSIDMTFS